MEPVEPINQSLGSRVYVEALKHHGKMKASYLPFDVHAGLVPFSIQTGS